MEDVYIRDVLLELVKLPLLLESSNDVASLVVSFIVSILLNLICIVQII